MIAACISEAKSFSHVIIPVCDHFFDGTEENYPLLERVFAAHPDCHFIEYSFDAKQGYNQFSPYFPEHPYWRHEWHNTTRWIGYLFTPNSSKYILFLDCDEIVDGARFKEWLERADISSYTALRLSMYWYFREACYRATRCDALALLALKSALKPEHLWGPDERMGTFIALPGNKINDVRGLDGTPLFDHYSWVRTREELAKKFTTWSHYWERPWLELLEKEYAGAFAGTDFVRHYSYEKVSPRFDPLAIPVPTLTPISLEQHKKNLETFPNVTCVDRRAMHKREILSCL